ncbi:MAG: hypothetical protein V4587_19920 [Acidobacteriota bacterium]
MRPQHGGTKVDLVGVGLNATDTGARGHIVTVQEISRLMSDSPRYHLADYADPT